MVIMIRYIVKVYGVLLSVIYLQYLMNLRDGEGVNGGCIFLLTKTKK